MTRLVVLAVTLVVAVASLVAFQGCKPPASEPSYAPSDDADAAFQAGANRPPTAKTLYAMARLLADQGRKQDAAATYSRCIREFPDFVPAYEELSQLYVQNDQIDAAITVLTAGNRAVPRSAELVNNLGMCHLLQQQFPKALECFSKAAACRPEDARFRANMALALGMMGRYDESLALSLQTVPPAQAHYNLGVIALARRDASFADKQFRLAIKADPSMTTKIPPPEKPALRP